MRKHIFPYFISYGKLDSVDATVEIYLSEKDSKKLERSARFGGRFRLNEDEALSDVYSKVYKAILNQEKAGLDAEGLDLADLMIDINYPRDLQLLECTIKKKFKQSVCESVIVERQQLTVYLQVPEHKKQVVYTDQGSTLYFVPIDFSGSFTVPSTVKQIDRKAFRQHKKITEVIIEEGATEIADNTFEGCIAMKHISVPSSVKRIGSNAFSKCEELIKIELSEGLLAIDNTAFRMCCKLEELVLPASLLEISAFINSYLTKIKTIVFVGMDTAINDKRGGDLRNVTICAPIGSVAETYAKFNNCNFQVLAQK